MPVLTTLWISAILLGEPHPPQVYGTYPTSEACQQARESLEMVYDSRRDDSDLYLMFCRPEGGYIPQQEH